VGFRRRGHQSTSIQTLVAHVVTHVGLADGRFEKFAASKGAAESIFFAGRCHQDRRSQNFRMVCRRVGRSTATFRRSDALNVLKQAGCFGPPSAARRYRRLVCHAAGGGYV